MKISLLHTTRGRPILAFKAFDEWVSLSDRPEEIEYIMALDDDDPTIPIYKEELSKIDTNRVGRFVFNVGETRNIVEALNKVSLLISDTSELIISIADDMGSSKGWDTLLLDILKPYNNFEEPKFIGVNDGIFGSMLYLIINKAWFKRVGHILYPEYNGCYADDDMRETAHRLNSIIEAPHILFEHRHWIVGKSENDATYMRHNTPESIAQNLAIYEKRAARNFDIQ